MVGNSLANTVIPVMDNVAVISILLSGILIIYSKADTFIEEKYYGFYSAFWFFALNVIVTIIVAFIGAGDAKTFEKAKESA